MSSTTSWFTWEGEKLLLHLRVQPKSSRDEFVGPHGEDCYKIKITAPPVDGQANRHLVKFLARAFGVPLSRVTQLSGENGRIKRFSIERPVRFPVPDITPPA